MWSISADVTEITLTEALRMRLGKITISGLQEWMDSWYDPKPWPQGFWVMAVERKREHEAWMEALEARLLAGNLMSSSDSGAGSPAYELDDPEKLVEWLDAQVQNHETNQAPVVVI